MLGYKIEMLNEIITYDAKERGDANRVLENFEKKGWKIFISIIEGWNNKDKDWHYPYEYGIFRVIRKIDGELTKEKMVTLISNFTYIAWLMNIALKNDDGEIFSDDKAQINYYFEKNKWNIDQTIESNRQI